MAQILTLAYMFPPIGGAGVQRNSKFVRYLPEFGYRPVVVTGPGASDSHWTPTDHSLSDDIPEAVAVHRIGGAPPGPAGRLHGVVGRALMSNSPEIQWWIDGAVSLGAGLIGDCELVYASLVPYEIAEAAVRTAATANKPWIADLQDPWALDEMWLYPSALHRRADLRRMRRVLASASAIVMNTPEAARRLVATFPELAGKDVVSIPNGYDAADFAGLPPSPQTERFQIIHTGYLHTEDGLRLRRVKWARRALGGWTGEIDILTRSHVYLLGALRLVVDADPSAATEIEVVLAGALTDADRAAAAGAAVDVSMPGYLDHASSVALVRSAGMLFLPMHDLPAGVRAGLVPGKTYEYLASGRPILAAVPDGDARDLLGAAGTARVCRPRDVASMAAAIRAELERWRTNEPAPILDRELVARYERRALTGRLAELFARVSAD
jgi:glycosyltransferase involved in cell wall biosynthesis